MANRKLVTIERVLEIIKERGPVLQSDIAFIFRKRRTRAKDTISRQVSDCVVTLNEQGKVIPATNRRKEVYWTAL